MECLALRVCVGGGRGVENSGSFPSYLDLKTSRYPTITFPRGLVSGFGFRSFGCWY